MRIVFGAVVSLSPFSAGMAWNWIQHALGFARLGHEVHFVEEVMPEWCVDEHGRPSDYEHSANRDRFRRIMERFGLMDGACQLFNRGEATQGISVEGLRDICRRADLLINMSGHIQAELILDNVPRRVYVDQDPVYTQLWRAEYGKDLNFSAHDVFFTVGLNIGTQASPIPDCGLRWHHVLPPVILDCWPVDDQASQLRFTTIASWSSYGDLLFRDDWYRSKYEEFRALSSLPRLVDQEFEVLLKSFRESDEGVQLLREQGWIISDSARIGDLDRYRDFIARSRAEIGIAKNAYVRGRSGWFSDRAAHYLASGRPVLAQSTGFEEHLPVGNGLLTFGTVQEAAAGVEEINHNYRRHCRDARDFAAEHLDHRKVLPAALDAATAT